MLLTSSHLVSQNCNLFVPQTWVKLPAQTNNLSIVDGKLYCCSNHLMLVAKMSASSIVALEADTAFYHYDDEMDYVVRNPANKHLYFTIPDKHSVRKLYEVIPREGKKAKVSRIKLSGRGTINHPTFSSDGRVMVFSSQRAVSMGGMDLYYSYLNDEGEWTEPRNMGSNINGAGDEVAPVIWNDYVFYASHDTLNNSRWNLCCALMRDNEIVDTVASMFLLLGNSPSFLLPEPFNSENDDFEMAIDTASRRLFLLSNRGGDQQLYLYSDIFPLASMAGTITNIEGRALSGVQVSVFRDEMQLCNVKSDSRGRYLYLLPQGSVYTLWMSKPGFFGNSVEVDTRGIGSRQAVASFTYNVALDNLALGKELYIYNVFGHGSSIEVTPEGRTKLQRIVRFLHENSQLGVSIKIASVTSANNEFNAIINSRRKENLQRYLEHLLPSTYIKVVEDDRVVNDENTDYNVRLAVTIQ